LRDFIELARSHHLKPFVTFSGGDPLLYERFWEILAYANTGFGETVVSAIMGNPDTVTPETALRLGGLGIDRFQMSLEGLGEVNDGIRGKGNFKKTIVAARILRSAGIRVQILFTLSKRNAGELIPVIDLVAAEEALEGFGFTRAAAFGLGRSLLEQNDLTTEEFRHLLLRTLERYRFWQEKNNPTRWSRKEPLFALLYDDLGLRDDTVKGGRCLLGSNQLSILSDGTIMPCRRLALTFGNWPEISIEQALKWQRENFTGAADIEGCRECELWKNCRGCRAVFYHLTQDPGVRDLHCWKP